MDFSHRSLRIGFACVLAKLPVRSQRRELRSGKLSEQSPAGKDMGSSRPLGLAHPARLIVRRNKTQTLIYDSSKTLLPNEKLQKRGHTISHAPHAKHAVVQRTQMEQLKGN
jgi:hypothetical protein